LLNPLKSQYGDGDAEGVADGVAEGVPEGVAEGVPDGVAEGVAEGVPDGVAEGVADGVALGVASSSCPYSPSSCNLAASSMLPSGTGRANPTAPRFRIAKRSVSEDIAIH